MLNMKNRGNIVKSVNQIKKNHVMLIEINSTLTKTYSCLGDHIKT